jgi:ribosomal protein S27E
MPIDVHCTSCGNKLRLPDTAAGKKIKCPTCAAVLSVPAAGAAQEIQALQFAGPKPVLPEVVVPSRRPVEELDEVLPSRRTSRDDDDEERFSRRGSRRDAHEYEPSGMAPLVLGIISIIFSVMAIPLAFVSCWPPIAYVAAGLAGLGLLLGGGGTFLAYMQKRGLPCPVIGTVISVCALIVAVTFGLLWAQAVATANRKINQIQESVDNQVEAQKRFVEEARKKQEEAQKRFMEEEVKKKEEEVNKVFTDPTYVDQKKRSQNNLRKIAKALLDYEMAYGSLPHARFGGVGKKGNLSWRVAILPFLGYGELYKKFDLTQPSIAEINRTAASKIPVEYISPRHPGEKNKTYYQVLVGDGLFADGNDPPQTKGLVRAANAVFMVVEAVMPHQWHDPLDTHCFSGSMPMVGRLMQDNGNHFNAAMASGDVYFISRLAWPDDQLKLLAPYNLGAVPLNWPPAQ